MQEINHEVKYLEAATLLLMSHYEMEEAREVAALLNNRASGQILDVMVLATQMALQSTPWWDSEDATERATNQLGLNTLLLPSLEQFVEDVETALGREVRGEGFEEKINNIATNAPRLLAEIKGESYVDPLEALMNMLQGAAPMDDDDIEQLGELAQDAGVSTGFEEISTEEE